MDLITGDSLAEPISGRGARQAAEAAPRLLAPAKTATRRQIAATLEGGYKYKALCYAFSAAGGLIEEVSQMTMIHSGR